MHASSPTAGDTAPLPVAPRIRRPGWRDPRLLLGLVLVAGAVALGSAVVQSAARTAPVLVAREALTPGQALTDELLEIRDVRLPDGTSGYLTPQDTLDTGAVVLRTVGGGELVPRGAIGQGADLDLRPLAVRPGNPVAAGVVSGSLVDLWLVPEEGDPEQVAAGLTVAEVAQSTGAFSIDSGTTVHVLVEVEELTRVLKALADPGSVEVVHVPGMGATP